MLTYHFVGRAAVPAIAGRRPGLINHLLNCDHYTGYWKSAAARVTAGIPRTRSAPVNGGANARTTLHQSILSVQRQTIDYNPAEQLEFENDCLKLIATGDLSFNFMDSMTWRQFVAKHMPGAKWVPRKKMSGQVLDRVALATRNQVRQDMKSTAVSLKWDGWNGPEGSHLMTFMITAGPTSHITKVVDTSSVANTADFRVEQIRDHLTELAGPLFDVQVIGLCSDDASVEKAARQRIVGSDEWSHLVQLPCLAHQLNLVVKDCLSKSPPSVFKALSAATAISKWFGGSNKLRGLLRKHQLQSGYRQLCFPVPVLTRWSSHYFTVYNLIEQEKAIRTLVMAREEEIFELVGNSGKNAASSLVQVIKDDVIWQHIKHLKTILAPLAIATNVVQASGTRLDEALVCFARLYHIFATWTSELAFPPNFLNACRQVISSLERRWAAMDQEPFIAALILNPFIGQDLQCFSGLSPLVSCGESFVLIQRLYRRLFRMRPEATTGHLFTEYQNYVGGEGQFAEAKFMKAEYKAAHDDLGEKLDPLRAWKLDGKEIRAIRALAERVLSFSCTTADTERAFSSFGSIWTKKRSRLAARKVEDIALIKAFTKAQEALAQVYKSNRARKITDKQSEAVKTFLSTSAVRSMFIPYTVEDLFDSGDHYDEVATALLAGLQKDNLEDLTPVTVSTHKWTLAQLFGGKSLTNTEIWGDAMNRFSDEQAFWDALVHMEDVDAIAIDV